LAIIKGIINYYYFSGGPIWQSSRYFEQEKNSNIIYLSRCRRRWYVYRKLQNSIKVTTKFQPSWTS